MFRSNAFWNFNKQGREEFLRSGHKGLVFISLGVLCATFGLKGFLLPNNFLDGVMGISLLVNYLTNID